MMPEASRLGSCLSRLLPHVDRTRMALTGGVALELHLRAAGQPRRRERLADVDFIARPPDLIPPRIAQDFLVSHYHLAQPGVPKALVQLVDPVTRLRLDFFPDLAATLPRAKPMLVADHLILVLDAPSLLDHKQRTLAKPPVDEKHWLDTVALAALCATQPPTRPARFVNDRYETDVTLVCERCLRSRSVHFPLAPKSTLFELLGYV